MKKHILALVAVFSVLTTWTSVSLAAEYEEVTYEDLLQQISAKKKAVSSVNSDDDIALHAGFGLVTSVSSVSINGSESTKSNNGFQFSLGIDLFDPNWIGEGQIRNFGQSTSGSESRSLREFSLKVIRREMTSARSALSVGFGMGTRYLKVSDEANGVSVNASTPTAILTGALSGYISKQVSLGLEIGARTAMVGGTADRSSLDAGIKLDTAF